MLNVCVKKAETGKPTLHHMGLNTLNKKRQKTFFIKTPADEQFRRSYFRKKAKISKLEHSEWIYFYHKFTASNF